MRRSRPRSVDILGAGPAGLTCALLLERAGWAVRLVRAGRRASRPIALAPDTVQMIEEIWGCELATACGAHPLQTRRVAWAPGASGRLVETAGLSLSADTLAAVLEAQLPERVTVEDPARSEQDHGDGSNWLLDARGPPSPQAAAAAAGRRRMWLWLDLPADGRLSNTAELFSGAGFWAFLLPTGKSRLCLQVATPGVPPDMARVAERLAAAGPGTLAAALAPEVAALPPTFATGTQIAPRLGLEGSPRRLAVGDRATSADPICGDGTGQGLRSALVVSAALGSMAEGTPAGPLLGHVRARHYFAFTTHLDHCLKHYATIAWRTSWRAEMAAMQEARSCAELAAPPATATFRLVYPNPATVSWSLPLLHPAEANAASSDASPAVDV